MKCASTSVLLSEWADSRSLRRVMLTIYEPSLLAPTETVKQIIINIEAGVEVEVTIAA